MLIVEWGSVSNWVLHLFAWLIDVMHLIFIRWNILRRLWCVRHLRCLHRKIGIPFHRSTAHQFRVDIWRLLQETITEMSIWESSISLSSILKQHLLFLKTFFSILLKKDQFQTWFLFSFDKIRHNNYRQPGTILQIGRCSLLVRCWLVLNNSHSTDFNCKANTRAYWILADKIHWENWNFLIIQFFFYKNLNNKFSRQRLCI